MVTLPYHLGPQNQFSLAYVTTDPDQFRAQLDTFTVPTQVISHIQRSLPTTAYLAYAMTPPAPSEPIQIPDHPFVKTMLRVFAGVVDGRRAAGDTLRANKTPTLDTIPTVLSDRIEWKQSVPTVGGQLLSNLILTHALPNANHRTSLGCLLIYLQSVGVSITADDLLASPVDEYIQTSKRLLTVRRNTTKFRILADCGCTTIERKGGIRIPLADYDLQADDPYTAFAHAHEQASIQFVEQLVDDTWHSEPDPGLAVLLDRL